MTAVHGAAGEVPGGAFFVPGQKPPEAEDRTGRRGNRRWFIALVGGGAAAVTASVVLPRWLDGDSGSNGGGGGNSSIDQAEGGGSGGGGAIAAGALFERPAKGDIQIDPTNIYHILEVTQNSDDINKRLDTLFGTRDLTFINPGTDLRHPWLQISDPVSHASLTMDLRPAGLEIAPGEQVPTWEQARRPETQGIQFYADTVVSFNDQFPRGTTIANVIGWTNVGTPDERMFTVRTENMPTLAGLSPEARRNQMLEFTHSLFQAQVLG